MVKTDGAFEFQNLLRPSRSLKRANSGKAPSFEEKTSTKDNSRRTLKKKTHESQCERQKSTNKNIRTTRNFTSLTFFPTRKPGKPAEETETPLGILNSPHHNHETHHQKHLKSTKNCQPEAASQSNHSCQTKNDQTSLLADPKHFACCSAPRDVRRLAVSSGTLDSIWLGHRRGKKRPRQRQFGSVLV